MSRDTDPQLAVLARKFPRWEIWRGGISGRYFARPSGERGKAGTVKLPSISAYVPLSADTPGQLGEAIERAEGSEP
jgi:hypothetical protein